MFSRADAANLGNMPVKTEELIEHGVTNIFDDLTDILASTKNDR